MWGLQVFGMLAAVAMALGNFMQDMSEDEAKEKMQCMSILICKLRLKYVVPSIRSQVGPQLKDLSFLWVTELYEFLDVKDTDAFWNDYPAKVCEKSQEERSDFMKEMAMRSGMYASEECEQSPSGAECVGLNKAVNKIEEILGKHYANGDCAPPSEAKDKMEGMADKMGAKPPMGPPKMMG